MITIKGMSQAPAAPSRTGFALLFSMSMAQFKVVLDKPVSPVNECA
jgi:hypothetical protein